jgi:hypothetical protein
MVRQLYNLEDRLFYASRTCLPTRSRRLEVWSMRVGALADLLEAGLSPRALRVYKSRRS